MAQLLGHILGNGYTTIAIAEMARLRENALFEELRIRTVLHHLYVVVGLDDQIVGTGNIGLHLVSNYAYISHYTEDNALSLNEIAYIIGAIVRNGKGSNHKVANLTGYALLQIASELRRNLLGDAIVAINALMHFLGGIDRH
jgi:hypothetical protein